jgi:heme exporter protein D
MQWASWAEFFYMGGYAIYVWPSFGFTALSLIYEVIALRKRRFGAIRLVRLLSQG